MIYENLFSNAPEKKINIGLIGSGTYGISLLMQVQSIPHLDIAVVCDRDPELAADACRRAGIPKERAVICDSRDELLRAFENGQCGLVENPELVMDAPIDVLVECTGNPEAGARHAELAIRQGKHIAMVTKETDAVVGPLLSRLADQAGIIYTPVDGDQHGLLIGLVSWARSIGLDVVCGGKARPYDFVYDEALRTVSNGDQKMVVPEKKFRALSKIQPGGARGAYEKRRALFTQWPCIAEADLCESVIAANATGLSADTPSMHAPVVRTVEIPEVLSPEAEGGILSRKGAIDVVTCLRRNDEAGLGGGVFLVFQCHDNDSWRFVREKGMLANHRGTCGAVYRPYHLLGIETPISILCAGLLKTTTGSLSYEPCLDLAATAINAIKAGTVIPDSHATGATLLKPIIVPAAVADGSHHLPYYMATGNRVTKDIAAGTVIARNMIEAPQESRLWALRLEQERVFKTGCK